MTRKILSVFAISCLLMASCAKKDNEDDSNAPLVNISKGEAPAVYSPEGGELPEGEKPAQQAPAVEEVSEPAEEPAVEAPAVVQEMPKEPEKPKEQPAKPKEPAPAPADKGDSPAEN